MIRNFAGYLPDVGHHFGDRDVQCAFSIRKLKARHRCLSAFGPPEGSPERLFDERRALHAATRSVYADKRRELSRVLVAISIVTNSSPGHRAYPHFIPGNHAKNLIGKNPVID